MSTRPSFVSAATRLAHGQFFGEQAERLDTAAVSLALMRPDSQCDVVEHTHETAHLILHLDGAYRSAASGAPTDALGPMLVYNPPGTTHRDHYARVGGVITGRFLSIGIADAFWATAVSASRLASDAQCRRDARSLALSARLVRAVRRTDGQPPGESSLDVDSLVLELLSLHAVRPARIGPARPPWLDAACRMLRDRCAESLEVREVAAACGVHPVYLARVFRRFLGQTPGEVLRTQRLEQAAALLTGTGRTLSDVALSCGYVDQSHLTTAFRRSHGLTPGAFRAAFGRGRRVA